MCTNTAARSAVGEYVHLSFIFGPPYMRKHTVQRSTKFTQWSLTQYVSYYVIHREIIDVLTNSATMLSTVAEISLAHHAALAMFVNIQRDNVTHTHKCRTTTQSGHFTICTDLARSNRDAKHVITAINNSIDNSCTCTRWATANCATITTRLNVHLLHCNTLQIKWDLHEPFICRDVTKFEFKFENFRTSHVFQRFEIRWMF